MATLITKRLLKNLLKFKRRDGPEIFGAFSNAFRFVQVQADLMKDDVDSILRKNERSTMIGSGVH